MAQIVVQDTSKVVQIKKFLGLNESPDGDTQLKMGEASEMRNWQITPNYHLRIRPGTRTKHWFSGPIRGLWSGYVGGREVKQEQTSWCGVNARKLCGIVNESLWFVDDNGCVREYYGPSGYVSFGLDSAYDDCYFAADGTGIGIRDGEVYTDIQNGYWISKVPGLQNAVSVKRTAIGSYAITDEGFLVHCSPDRAVLVPVVNMFDESPKLISTNLTEDHVLLGDTLVLTFNEYITQAG